jgi:hypothetical protein
MMKEDILRDTIDLSSKKIVGFASESKWTIMAALFCGCEEMDELALLSDSS